LAERLRTIANRHLQRSFVNRTPNLA